jgi:hypothetical protein
MKNIIKKILKITTTIIGVFVLGFVLLVIYFAINPTTKLKEETTKITPSITLTEIPTTEPTKIPTPTLIITPTLIASVSAKPTSNVIIIPTKSNAPTPTKIKETTNNIVKKSKSGICHASGTTYYDKTTNYTSYKSIDECLNSGGRLPKN